MEIYDLDIDEKIDIIKIWDNEYKIWDIKPSIIKKIQNIPTIFIWDKKFLEKWKKIIEEILLMKNKEVDMSDFSEKHISKMISIISKRI